MKHGAKLDSKNSSKLTPADILLQRKKVEMLDIVEKKRGITLQTVKGLSDAILCEKVQVEILSLI